MAGKTHVTPAGATAQATRPLSAVLAVQGLALAGLVVASGSPAGRVVRLVAVAVVTAGALAVVHAPARWPRGVVALAGGCLGTVVGAGIGVPRLTLSGPDAVAVLGLVCLATGLTLLVLALTELVAALPGWWWLLAVPAFVAVVVMVLFPVTVAVYATNVPHGRTSTATPADRGFAYENVVLPTVDGARLAAWYVPGSNQAAVVVLHGAGAASGKASVLDQGAVLARHGYGVLLLDARGHGGSSGYAMDFGWFGEADVSAAVDYLVGRPDVDAARIGVLGESMGGEEAIGALAADRRLGAAVAEGATNRVAEDRGWLPSGLDGIVQRGLDRVTYTVAGWLTSAPEPLALRDSLARAAPRPVLLVVAGSVPDELAAAGFLRSASPGSVSVWVVDGAGHTAGLTARPAGWADRVTTFLDAALGPAG